MGKKSGKNELAKVDPVYVLGLDANGKTRGARFAELKDNIASAAITALKGQADAALAEVRCISPVTSGLPRSWEEIAVGHMVLAHESPDDGWWEAVVIQRDQQILT